MDRRFYLASIRSIASTRRGIVGAVNFNHLSLVVLDDALRRYEVSVAQPNFFSGRESEVFWWRHFTEVVLLDVEFSRERHFARARIFVFRIVLRVHLFNQVGRIVVDYDLQRA